ncbi:hypothetical protein Goshw_029725 [Gossypium schwendimanii]|uniref:Uncharacterized protein n=1 Tax=Gossypium schwendimanii TaxID=34291 RepID=A0A7J9MKU6_GOSSC|nr:hypothetical protein [Gossypium schwendimanii]
MGLIRSTFEESVADKILRIPLGRLEHGDIVMWRGEPSEAFSMRSAYKLLLDSNRDSQFTVLQNATKGFYRKLWNLSLTTKQKITTWKISWNFLPTLVNLYNRRIEVQLVGVQRRSTMCFGTALKTCCVLWVIWNERNKSLHEGFKNFRRWAAEAVGKYIMKLDGLSSHVLTRKCAISKWIPFIDPFIQINFNAAFDLKEYRSGSSVVVRDDRGDVIISKSTLHGGSVPIRGGSTCVLSSGNVGQEHGSQYG